MPEVVPTPNQRAVALKVKEKLEKGEKIEIGPIMREVGYAATSALHPTKALTSTPGWKKLMDEYLPDLKLLEVHAEGLLATTKDGKPDFAVRHKYLETGYKVKAKISGDVQNTNIVIPILGGFSVQTDNSDKENSTTEEKN